MAWHVYAHLQSEIQILLPDRLSIFYFLISIGISIARRITFVWEFSEFHPPLSRLDEIEAQVSIGAMKLYKVAVNHSLFCTYSYSTMKVVWLISVRLIAVIPVESKRWLEKEIENENQKNIFFFDKYKHVLYFFFFTQIFFPFQSLLTFNQQKKNYKYSNQK